RNAAYLRQADITEPISYRSLTLAQTLLPDDTVLLDYFILENQILLFVVTQSDISVYQLGDILAVVEEWMEYFRLNCSHIATQIANPSIDYVDMLTRQAQEILHELYTLLIQPAIEKMTQYESCVIIPHRSLRDLPYHALFSGTHYLIEQFQISYLPNLTLLQYCQPHPPRIQMDSTNGCDDGSVIFGYPNGHLWHTVEEANQVAAILGGAVYTNEQATLKNVRQTVPKARIVHIAAHAMFHPEKPLFSGLSLADGVLTTLDIFQEIRFQASLVTLSACWTGAHAISQGDELLGLSRSLFYAGTATLVACYWPVEDGAATHLMTLFYTYLSNDMEKGRALQQAQLQLIQQRVAVVAEQQWLYAHPYIWGAYYLQGHAGPL
ncbi:MAG: CHAT domain-containing protein, partial [Chloroflexota bacterium]